MTAIWTVWIKAESQPPEKELDRLQRDLSSKLAARLICWCRLLKGWKGTREKIRPSTTS
jgi:hypothetical protein